ncbi:MAG TPA: Asp23/Gls24 family envelope stress response protein [Clostridiaceae bacterium]
MDEEIKKEIDLGIVKISDDVVCVIAGLAAAEVKGVIGMSASLVGGIAEILRGKRNMSKGVKVTVGENSATIDLYLAVEYGIKIPEVAMQVQDNVKKAVELMTGLVVSEVNIHVQNVVFVTEEKEEENKEI